MKDCEQTIIDERNVCALAHDLEEASTFGSCGYASNQDYISELLMKAADTIIALLQSKSEGKYK